MEASSHLTNYTTNGHSLYAHEPPLTLTIAPTPPFRNNKKIADKIAKIFRKHASPTEQNKTLLNLQQRLLFKLILQKRLPLNITVPLHIVLPQNPPSILKTHNHFIFTKSIIGQGANQKVKLGFDANTLNPVAYSKTKTCPETLNVIKQLNKLSKIPQILSPLHICLYIGKNNVEKILTVSNYCNKGSLYEYTKSHRLSYSQALTILKDCLIGLMEIEKQKLSHRDIKPENIFLSETSGGIFHATIGDFEYLTEVQPSNDKTMKGSHFFLSPEIILLSQLIEETNNLYKSKQTDDPKQSQAKIEANNQLILTKTAEARQKADIWAMGLILYFLRKSCDLYDSWTFISHDDFYKKLASLDQNSMDFHFPNRESDPLEMLNYLMLKISPEERLSAAEAFEYLSKLILALKQQEC